MEQLSGKVILITGATNGIGREAAKALAGMGAQVVVVGRSRSRTEQVVQEIEASGGQADLLVGDLSVMDEVRRVAAEFRAKHDRLDVLINNAGAFYTAREVTADGLEKTFALNHMSYFVLTNALLDMLHSGARVINTSSDAHKGGSMNFDDLQGERRFSGWAAYGQSKLANILFSDEMARRLRDTGVSVNSVHPGFVNTGFGKNNGGIVGAALGMIAPLFARTPEQGAETLIYLAASPEVEGVTGEYFADKKIAAKSRAAQSAEAARRLWAVSEELAREPAAQR